jgi:hypothetical protein
MAGDSKLSALPLVSSLGPSDRFYVVQGGLDKGCPPSLIGGPVGNMTPVQLAAYVNDSTIYNIQTGTSYTLQASDRGKVVTLNNAAPVALTCPAGLGAGFSCMIVQLGAGLVGVGAGAGALVNSFGGLTHLAGQYAMGLVMCPTANSFILGGQLS